MDFGDDLDPRSLESRARLHEEHRQRVIVTLLTEFYLMGVADIFPKSIVVGTAKAHWQDAVGSALKGTQAAHCVPCQIEITGRQPQQYLRKYSDDRAKIIEAYFGKTDDFLPAVFNKCDSYSESHGLIEAFQDACLDVIEKGINKVTFHEGAVSTSVRNAFSIYRTGAKETFRKAIEYYQGEKNRVDNSVEKKKQATSQISIVEFYKSEVRYSTALNDCLKIGEIEDSIAFYKKIK